MSTALAQLGVFGIQLNQDAVATKLDADFGGGAAPTEGIEYRVAIPAPRQDAGFDKLRRVGGKMGVGIRGWEVRDDFFLFAPLPFRMILRCVAESADFGPARILRASPRLAVKSRLAWSVASGPVPSTFLWSHSPRLYAAWWLKNSFRSLSVGVAVLFSEQVELRHLVVRSRTSPASGLKQPQSIRRAAISARAQPWRESSSDPFL